MTGNAKRLTFILGVVVFGAVVAGCAGGGGPGPGSTGDAGLAPIETTAAGQARVIIGFKQAPGNPEKTLVRGLGGNVKHAYHLIPAMAATVPEAAIDITITNQVPPFGADAKSGIVPLTLRLAGQNQTYAVSYATEAGLFQLGGSPSIVCGPGNIAQAHSANEFLRIEELDKCLRFLGRLADWAEN